MATLTVGAGGMFATIASALAASHDGDTIAVKAGTYVNDFSYVTTKVTLVGVGGQVNMVATVPPPNGKAILCTDTDVTIRNFTFSGVAVRDLNGAGIRQESGNLVVQNCDFHDNQEGILAPGMSNGTGSIVVDGCTFTHNGAGDGYSHNIYVGNQASCTITNSLFQDSVIGHEIKSRAQTSIIQNNRIIDGPDGTGSYSIDLPNGGAAVVTGNVIEKGPNVQNRTIIHYGGESLPYPGSSLVISGNTVTNDCTAGPVIGLLNATGIVATVSGNTFLGTALAQVAQGAATLTGNTMGGVALPDSTTAPSLSTGNAVVFTDAAAHTVTLAPQHAAQGGAGLLTATGAAHDTLVGGAGGLTYAAQGGGDSVTTAAGATDRITLAGAGSTVLSRGSDWITSGTGNDSIEAAGNATILGSTGSSSFTLDGAETLTSRGADTVTVQMGATATVAGGTFLTLASNGGSLDLTRTVPHGEADAASLHGWFALRAYAGSGLVVQTAAGQVGSAISLHQGNNVVTSAGADTVQAGSGADSVIVSSAALVTAGSGTLSVFGRGETSVATVVGGAATVLDGDTGRIRFVGGAVAGTLTDRLANVTVQGGAGHLSVAATAGNSVFAGGAGGIDLAGATSGGDRVTTAAGSTNAIDVCDETTVQSAGTDHIRLEGWGNAVTVAGAAQLQAAMTGTTVEVDGTALLTLAGSGADSVTVGAGAAAAITDTASLLTVTDRGGTVSLADAAGGNATALSLSGGSAAILATAGSPVQVTTGLGGAVAVQLSTGRASVRAQGHDTVATGAGAATVMAMGSVQVNAGSGSTAVTGIGSTSIAGGSGSVSYAGWAGALTFVGGSGTASLQGGSGTVAVTAGSGNLTLVGGSAGAGAQDVVQFGSGHATVTSGGNQETYRFVLGQGGGSDLIQNFKVGVDQLSFQGFTPGRTVASSAVLGGSLHLQLTDGTAVTLAGVSHLAAALP